MNQLPDPSALPMESAPVSLLMVNADGAIKFANQSALHRFGVDRQQLQGAHYQDLFVPGKEFSWPSIWEQLKTHRTFVQNTVIKGDELARLVEPSMQFDVHHELVDEPGIDPYALVTILEASQPQKVFRDLQRTESIQRAVMESSLDSIMLLDRDATIRFINRTHPDLTKEQVIGTSIFAYVAEKYHDTMKQCFDRVFRTGKPDAYQVDFEAPGGEVSTWEARVAPVLADGEISGLAVIARDVTERNHVIAALSERERSLKRAQQIARMGSWEFDLKTGKPNGSKELFRILGMDEAAELPSVEVFLKEYLHEDDHDFLIHSFERVLTTGVVAGQEFRIRRKPDNQIRFIRAENETLRDDSGMPIKQVGTFQDITAQKEAELALRESEEKFRVLTEESPSIVYIARDFRILYCNANLSSTSGYSVTELLSIDCRDLIAPEHVELVSERHIQRLRGEDPPSRYEIKFISKQGKEIWLDLASKRIDYEGKPAVLVSCVDITDRKDQERQLSEMANQLSHVTRLTTMGEMVAGIAHEINQPLSAIANFAFASQNALEAGGKENEASIKKWLESISKQAVRSGDIIRRLRNFTRKSTGERVWVDLNRVIQDSIALIKSDSQNRGVSVACHLPESPALVNANYVEIQQVVVNLLGNACEATRGESEPRITVTLEEHQGTARLTVEDNGPGVSEGDLTSIFDAFFTTKTDGMGMGLAISKSIVESHEGSLMLEEGDETGARFRFQLPVGASRKVTG